MKRTWLITSLLLGLGCSAGGAADGNTVTTRPVEPGTLPPIATTPSNPGTAPGPGSGELIVSPEDLEPPDECDGNIPVVYRDFSDAHPDFEMDFSGDVVRRKLIS